MLTNIFESRNKTFLNLIKLGDYIGRSLRENLEILSVEDNFVTYLTESGYVIKGKFNNNSLNLTDIQIQDGKLFEDKKACSLLTDKKISNLLADILENDLSSAKNTFEGILNLWESKLKFDKVKSRLEEKAARFDESFNIVRTPEFERLMEAKDAIVELLSSNKEYVLSPEIRNTVKLASTISKSFSIPKLTLDNLSESTKYQIPDTISHSLYNHLCKQELVAKELVESKNSLENIWVTNEKIQKLPSFIYESDKNVMQLVAEIISEIPYFAMATKKQLTSMVEGNLDLLMDTQAITDKEVKSFVSKIYEFKKPVKEYILTVLNESYGIDIQSLTDKPTFDSLIKTEVFIFEALANICKENSNLQRILVEFSNSLIEKSGVESIDVADFINEIYEQCGYSKTLNETSLLNYLNFEKVADDLGKIGQVLKMIQAGAANGALGGISSAMGQPAEMGMGEDPGQDEMLSKEGEYEPDGGEDAGMGQNDESPVDGEFDTEPDMDAQDAADEVNAEEEGGGEEMGEEGMEGEEDMEGEEEAMPEGEEEVQAQSKESLIDNMKELEELISTLKADMGAEGGEEDMEGEEGHEEPDGDEVPDIETGEGDDAVHIDVGSHNEDEEEEEEGEAEGEEEEEEEEA